MKNSCFFFRYYVSIISDYKYPSMNSSTYLFIDICYVNLNMAWKKNLKINFACERLILLTHNYLKRPFKWNCNSHFKMLSSVFYPCDIYIYWTSKDPRIRQNLGSPALLCTQRDGLRATKKKLQQKIFQNLCGNFFE